MDIDPKYQQPTLQLQSHVCLQCYVQRVGGGFFVCGVSDSRGQCMGCRRELDEDCQTNENLRRRWVNLY